MTAFATVHAALAATAAAHGDKPFLIVPSDQVITYRDAAQIIATLRKSYADAGYGHGHRVALLLENRPEFLLHYLALNALGIGIVPINPDYRHDEMLYLVEHSEVELAVTLPAHKHRLAKVAHDRARSKPLAILDAHELPGTFPPPSAPAPDLTGPNSTTECSLLYTSGTTGRPKGCILTNHYYLTAGAGYRDHGGLITIRQAEERFYNPLPLFHMNHQAVTVTCAILTANALILTERFSPTRWWREVSDCGATIVHYLGIVAPTLLNQPVSDDEKRHRVRFGVGAGVEPSLHDAFEKRFGFPLIEVWGMTETGRLFTDNFPPRMTTTRAFGRPVPGYMEARVVDENDFDVAVGAPGELIVRHSAADPRGGFFSGYLKNEKATEDAWRNGWFHTGDVVSQDASGMLFFIDRKKHIIRRAGENIAAAEIEAVLQAHVAVAQVAVVAAPDEIREEEVYACIVPMPDVQADSALADELLAWCNDRLAYFKAPGWIQFRSSLPTTGTQKVQKTHIFAANEDPRRAAGAIDLRAKKRRS
jgi:crotonobetaine/carnitine-CoA ligase